MWFKNLRVYRLTETFTKTAEELAEAMQCNEFVPCGKMDAQRSGWVPPAGDAGTMLTHAANGCIMVAMKTEEKVLPSAAVNEELNKQVKRISEQESRAVGRKERQQLKDEVIITLMPRAFTKSSVCHGYIDVQRSLLIINATTHKIAEHLIALLRDSLGRLPCIPLIPRDNPLDVMTDWLKSGTEPEGYIIGDECELAGGQDQSKVTCRRLDLSSEEVLSHIENGMRVSKLALEWREGTSFVLDDQLTVKRMKFGDIVQARADGDTAIDSFDHEFAVMTVEIRALINDLLEAFGGELEQ